MTSIALSTPPHRSALGDVMIRPTWLDYEHVSDSGILRQICDDDCLEYLDSRQRVRECFGALVLGHLSRIGPFSSTRGAIAQFKELHIKSEFEVGMAAGGRGHTARLQLLSAGYERACSP